MTDDLFLVRYRNNGAHELGLERGAALNALKAAQGGAPLTMDWLLSAANGAPGAAGIADELRRALSEQVARGEVTLDAPVGNQEIWAAGVTYKRSEEAREAESHNSNLYTRVYGAARPELFFKALGADAVPSGGAIGVRYDSAWSVPEPELVVVLNASMEVVGFTIGNDVSSRDIEGENPLYLPQAKIYDGACAIGPRVWLQLGATKWPDVKIEMGIERGGQTVFRESTSTASIKRPLTELIEYLGRCKAFPRGVLLLTGTGLVPPDDFTLQADDVVRIRIEPIGELVNTVRVVGPLNGKQAIDGTV